MARGLPLRKDQNILELSTPMAMAELDGAWHSLDAVRLVSEVISLSVLAPKSAIRGKNLEEKMQTIDARYLPVSVA